MKKARNWVLLLSGLAVIAHETLASGRPRIELLIIAGQLCGLPFVLRLDDALRSRSQRRSGVSRARQRS